MQCQAASEAEEDLPKGLVRCACAGKGRAERCKNLICKRGAVRVKGKRMCAHCDGCPSASVSAAVQGRGEACKCECDGCHRAITKECLIKDHWCEKCEKTAAGQEDGGLWFENGRGGEEGFGAHA